MISAAEASSDVHGAQLLRALKAEGPALNSPIDAFGVGGPKLQAEGLRAVVDAKELLSMGFLEILSRLPRIFEALKRVTEAAEAERPDVIVVIDYPDFHFRLARRLRRLGVPVIYYIPPKAWAWRKKRVEALRSLFARVLCILPFEESFFAAARVPVKYVGNPLVDELPLGLSREEARRKLALGPEDRVLAAMPGSRPAELKRHLELMLDSCVRAAALMRASGKLGARAPLRVLVPLPATADAEGVRERVDAWVRRASGAEPGRAPDFILDVRVYDSATGAGVCLAAADAGLIKSGTATLEAGLMGCPHVVVYKPNPITCFIFRHVIRYRGPVGLVNLVAGGGADASTPRLMREILCGEMTVRNLSDEIVSLLTDESRRAGLSEGLRALRERLVGSIDGSAQSPSVRAAREILSVAGK